MRIEHLKPEFVETFPAPLDDGVLYISTEFGTCAHLCACGCGEEVVTPLSPAQWSFTYDGQNVSLRPSVGNWTLQCQSHYVVHGGRVRWARQFAQFEIGLNRMRDRSLLGIDGRTENHDAYADSIDTSQNVGVGKLGVSCWARFRQWLRRRS